MVFGCLSSTFGQVVEKQTEAALWRTRADTVTTNILKETVKVSELKRAVVYARLADAWWNLDKDQSNAWLEKAVDVIFFYSNDDIKRQPKEYAATVKQIVTATAGRNQKQFDRLIGLAASSNKADTTSPRLDANALIDLAMTVVKSNPHKAAEIGILAFRVGQPDRFHHLYWELKKSDAVVAENFIREAISFARLSRDLGSAMEVKTAVFPEIVLPTTAPTSIVSSNSIKIAALNYWADFLVDRYTQLTHRSIESCSTEASLFFPLRHQLAALLPQREPAVAQAITMCLAGQSPAKQNVLSSLPNDPSMNTVEGLLKLADEAKEDIDLRSRLLLRAVSLANKEQKYKLATQILDNMSEEEKKVDKDFWTVLRYTVAAGWAYQQYADGDVAGADRTLEAVDSDTRPFSKIGFVLKFKSNNDDSKAFCLVKLDEADKELDKSGRPFVERTAFWLQVVKLYSSFDQHLRAAEVFQSFAKAFNKAASDKKAIPQIKSAEIVGAVSPRFLAAYDLTLFAAVGVIEEPDARLQIQMAFLEISLNEFSKTIKAKETATD